MYTTIDTETHLREMMTNTGENLYELSQNQLILLVFLRHFGCTFCREALADLSESRARIEALGARLVFVHMSDNETANRYFEKFQLRGAVHVSDPDCTFYSAFGLTKGTFNQLFGLQTWVRGFQVGLVEGHGIGKQLGDGFQMPGIFVVQDGDIRNRFIHKLASERPDYLELVRGCAL
jgi:peroxiredoxin